MILGVESDILFPIYQQKELAEYLSADSTKVTYKSLNCLQGHDSFLVDIETFSREISYFLFMSLNFDLISFLTISMHSQIFIELQQ